MKKTGLAGRMRAWMAEIGHPLFSLSRLYQALHIPPGPKRNAAYSAVKDFQRRGEILRVNGLYQYNPARKKASDVTLKSRMLRAMRLLSFQGPFTVAHLQRMAGVRNRKYADRVMSAMVKAGYLERKGLTLGMGTKKARLYLVTDPDRFRKDLLP